MYDFEATDLYLTALHYTDVYKEKSEIDRRSITFTAYDKLLNVYDDVYLTPKVVGLQTLYMIEGEEEEFSKFKRHGVKSMGLKGMSFSFIEDGSGISPEAKALIERAIELENEKNKKSGARVGRLI